MNKVTTSVVRWMVLKALVAAREVVGSIDVAGVVLAMAALATARVLAETGAGSTRYLVADERRQTFSTWVGWAELGADDQKRAGAVLAACSAAGCVGREEWSEAERLAKNAVRFATEASGGEYDLDDGGGS